MHNFDVKIRAELLPWFAIKKTLVQSCFDFDNNKTNSPADTFCWIFLIIEIYQNQDFKSIKNHFEFWITFISLLYCIWTK